MTPQEQDFEPGHPKRCDYDPMSAEALAWARNNYAPLGERDFPLGHPKAMDTEGNQNRVPVLAGEDPLHPELQPFSGRTPGQVKAIEALNTVLAKQAKETPARKPITAPEPPEPIERPFPTGQPDTPPPQELDSGAAQEKSPGRKSGR